MLVGEESLDEVLLLSFLGGLNLDLLVNGTTEIDKRILRL